MASSMLTGDRRWASSRKLTVLGKVPKPINLPSQRLENHGLDPNVEIVPKGTSTWGSKPSLAAPNAWGTSSISSPHTDGSAGSPIHRPSSGGSGTRPSTAGSERSHEPVSNAWAANSRPSSASGILASSQISAAATRPRSAETRPGSSQLSRFADNSVDSAAVWGAAGTAERVGTASSKSSRFTLSSGDFPSLGSDKNSDTHSQRGHSSQGRPHSSQGCPHSSQGRPASASGTDSKPKGILEPQLAGHRNIDCLDHGTVNTWKADNPPYAGHGASPNMQNWQRDSHSAPPYPNMNMPPPHYDSWHNPPFRPADGVWYRDGAAGGPYRPPGPPGSYPIDYPHGPARPLSNPQFPRLDAGPGGFYPNNCKPYRPYMPPEQYMGAGHPDVPVRPGAYPGPVPYEGHYGPPRPNFYSSIDREASIMGMARPVVHNQYPSQHQNYDSANFHARPGGSATVVNKAQIKPDQTHGAQSGPYRVLLKQHDGSENCDELEKREHSVTAGSTHLEKGNHPRVSTQKGDWGTKSQTQETTVSLSLLGATVSSQSTSGVDVQSTDTIVRNSVADSSKAADDGLVRRLEVANIQSRDPQQYAVIKKDATLLEKVEGLNNKARIADNHSEVGAVSSKEKQTYLKDVNARADRLTKVACAKANSADNAASTLNMETAIPKELNALADDKNQGTSSDGKVFSVSLYSAGAGEINVAKNVDHQAKIRSNRHNNDERMKKSTGSESSLINIMICVKGRADENDASEEASEKQELHHPANVRDDSQTVSSLDPVDQKAQRAKRRELAIQRAKQLQQEEEERTREQKARALAKLEELNRRTLAESSNPNQKSDHAPQQKIDVHNSKQESGPIAMTTADTSVEASSANSAYHSETVKQLDDSGIKKPGDSTDLSSNAAAQTSHSATQSSMMPQAQSLSIRTETDATSKITLGTASSDIQHNTIAKQKQVGYRKKQSNPQENNMGGEQITLSGTRSPKDTGEIAVNASRNDTLPNNEEPPAQHKKKNNKGARNNNTNKLDEGLTSSILASSPHTEGSSEKLHTESAKTKPSTSVEETISVPSETSNETVGTPDMPVNRGLSEIIDEARGRVSNQWKPHPQRKTTRNQQPNKPVSNYHVTEAVMWAPVKPPRKNETSEEVNQNSMTEPTKPSGKSGNDLQNGLKAKRAEIERYVSKPVTKELSQQANSQQSSPALSQAASGDVTGKSETGSPSVATGRFDGPPVGKAAASSDTRNRENSKHSKNGRTNASWRQRSSAESPPFEGSLPSDQAKTVQKASDEFQTSNISNLPKAQLTDTDDGWNDNYESVLPSESVTSTVVGKNYGASRQRRQSYKVHRGVSGSNYSASDNMDSQQGISDKSEHQSPVLAHNESEGRNAMRTESHNAWVEHAKPHWQPKSQTYIHGRQGNRGNSQRVASEGTENVQTIHEDINTSSQRTTLLEPRDTRRQESRRESKVTADPAKEQTIAEPAPPDAAYPREQAVPLGANQRGQHNRFQREYDPNYRGWDWGQDSSKPNFHMYGDKRKNNSHTEYQRIGSYDKPGDTFQQNSNAGEGAHEASRAYASRYRERSRHFQRGGGQFYGRSTGAAARVNDSYNSGE